MPITDDQAMVALQTLGWERKDITEDMRDHLRVLMDAFDIYVEREATHAALWKEYGAGDTAFHLKSKALRVLNNVENEDDALDAINYAAFTVRNVRAGRL